MLRLVYLAGAALLPIGLATLVFAGMKQDLSNCTAAQGQASAEACSRVMNSGRLPDEQRYIGHFNRGMGYHHAGEYMRAWTDFNEAIKLHKFARGYHARAFLKQDMGAFDGALADMDRAVALAPSDWFGFYYRALLQRDRGDYDGATADLYRAAKLAPDEKRIRLMQALVLADAGDIDAAREMINKVISEGGNESAGFYARAAVAFKEGRMDAAKDDLAKVLELGKDVVAARTLMGRIREARGDILGAKKHYRLALAEPDRDLEGRPTRRLARERLAVLERGAKGSPDERPLGSSKP
jgi:tetratricopeptide (TPR) repeat protein